MLTSHRIDPGITNHAGSPAGRCPGTSGRQIAGVACLLLSLNAWSGPTPVPGVDLILSGKTNTAAASVAITINEHFPPPGTTETFGSIAKTASDPFGSTVDLKASADLGLLHASATVSQPPPFVLGPMTFVNSANGTAQAHFHDILTSAHASLSAIDVHIRMVFHGSVSPPDFPSFTFARGTLLTNFFFVDDVIHPFYHNEQVNDGTLIQPGEFVEDHFLTVPAGIDFGIEQTLRAEAFATSTSRVGGAFADLSSTGLLYIDVLTPGGTLVAKSGHIYASPVASPVPEPSMYALILAGIGLLRFTSRRRGRA